jgi:hypothetical protein
MNFIISHLYREGNYFANKLANLGVFLTDYTWWSLALVEIREDLPN